MSEYNVLEWTVTWDIVEVFGKAVFFDDEGVCTECQENVQDEMRTLRQDFADQLSYFFQLDDVAA